MNHHGRLADFFLATALLAGFAALATAAPTSAAPMSADAARFTLRLAPGPAYKYTSRWLVFPVSIYPQVACWIETPRGDYVDTIYVTAKGATKKWVSAPRGGRPEALPVWFHLQEGRPTKADAVSGPTPSGATTRGSALAAGLPAGSYVVKLEVNRSYDYNEVYTKANSGVAGQPSLIYSCGIELGAGPSSAVFRPIGRGSVDGSDGEVRPGLEGITTALELLDSAEIFYEGGSK